MIHTLVIFQVVAGRAAEFEAGHRELIASWASDSSSRASPDSSCPPPRSGGGRLEPMHRPDIQRTLDSQSSREFIWVRTHLGVELGSRAAVDALTKPRPGVPSHAVEADGRLPRLRLGRSAAA